MYADSLSWGIIPNSRERFAFDERWPGVMELELQRRGYLVRVIEDCLNGRRTKWEDPIKPGRNGVIGLGQRIEVNTPLILVVVFLGTNDFQVTHDNTVADSAAGVGEVVEAIRRAPIEPGMEIPKILVVAPPPIQIAKGEIAEKFQGAETKARGLASEIEKVAAQHRCEFFDAGAVTETSRVDGVHLDADQHLELGQALANKVGSILQNRNP